MKFRDHLKGFNQESKTNENLSEAERQASMKYQALAMAKEVHSNLAELSFVEMMGVMSPDNPAKKEVQELEKQLNELTRQVGDFVIKYMPDVAAAEPGDTDEIPPEDEEGAEPQTPQPKKPNKDKEK
ncbi:hypothetical protein [Vibrio phage phiKT1024]|nr:hypothetical protein [Vibrio phage phiKT1024]